jgi:mannonate dehydratase
MGWGNAEYFVKAVMPTAEKFGVKMALHPDDPPLSPLRWIGRILTSRAAYQRVMDFARAFPRRGRNSGEIP